MTRCSKRSGEPFLFSVSSDPSDYYAYGSGYIRRNFEGPAVVVLSRVDLRTGAVRTIESDPLIKIPESHSQPSGNVVVCDGALVASVTLGDQGWLGVVPLSLFDDENE